METKSSDGSQTEKNAKMPLAPTISLEGKWFPHKRDFLLLMLLTVFMILHNAAWLSRDNLNPSSDEALYLLKSLETFEMITDPSPDTLKTLYFQSVGPRPTFFFTALSVPFYLLFGTSGDVAILGVNSLLYVVIIFGTYVIGAHFFGRRVGLLAAMVTCLNQEIATLSRVFWPHFSVVAIVVAGSCLLFKGRLLTNKKCTLSFGFLLGFGLMMRPVYPVIFLIGPMIVVAVLALFDNSREKGTISILRDVKREVVYANFKSRIIGGLLPACAITGVVAGPFYFQFMSRTFAFVRSVNANSVWRDLGFFWYLNNIQKNISLGVVVFIVIGLAWGLVVSRSSSGALLLCTSIMFVMISALPRFKAFFYFAPIYPFLLILAVHWIFEIGRPWLRWILSVFLVSFSGLVFIQSAWQWPNILGNNIPIKYLFGVHPEWIAKVDNLDYHLDEAAELIRSDAYHDVDLQDHAVVVSFVSCDSFLHSANFNYASWPTGKDYTYIEAWFPLSAVLLADYVLVDLRCPITPVQVIAASPKILLNPDSAFYENHRRIANYPIKGQRLLEVYKRTSPSSQSDIKAITAELRDAMPNAANLIRREIPMFAKYDPLLVPAMKSALANSVELEPQR